MTHIILYKIKSEASIFMNKKDQTGKADKILSSINADALQKGIDKLKGISEEESANLKKHLDGIDKQKVLDLFNSLTPEQIKQKLENLDISKLNELKKGTGIINKIKKDKKQR